jgi:hypothetical protein
MPSGYEFEGTLGEMTLREIVELHPLPGSDLRDALLRCAEECLDCGASCTACVDASLSERDVAELTGVTGVAPPGQDESA